MVYLTVEQLDTLARRARARGSAQVWIGQWDALVIEYVETPRSLEGLDGPDETIIERDGSVVEDDSR
jgi:hypothetical protein